MYSNRSGSSAYRQFRFECNSDDSRRVTCFNSAVHRKRNVSNSTVSRWTWSLMLEEMNAIEACMRSQQSKLTKSFDVANRPMCFKLQGLQVCVQIWREILRNQEIGLPQIWCVVNSWIRRLHSWQSTRSIQIQSDKLAMPNASDICNKFITNRIPLCFT